MKIPLINMILFFVAIQCALILVANPDLTSSATLFPNNINSSDYTSSFSILGFSPTAVWDVIMFPQQGTSSTLFILFLAMAAAIAIIAAVQRIDTGVWASVFIMLLGLGSVPIMNLYRFIDSSVGEFACAGLAGICWPANFVAMIVCGLLSIFWVWGCISWWSNRYD
jgi:hypothetical protein